MRFRKKPFEVEAIQWFPPGDPRWPGEIEDVEIMYTRTKEPEFISAYVITNPDQPERRERIRLLPGDWIITDPEGNRYPCREHIFDQTYERV